MQKSGIMKSGLDAMPLFLQDDLLKRKTWHLPVVQVPKALQGWYYVVPWLPLLVISCIPWHFSSHEGCSWNPSWWAEPAAGAALRNLEHEFSSEILDQVETKCHSSCTIWKIVSGGVSGVFKGQLNSEWIMRSSFLPKCQPKIWRISALPSGTG